MKKSKWKIDNGFVESGSEFFHIRDVKSLSKKGEKDLLIFLNLAVITLAFENKRDRDAFFANMVKLVKSYVALEQRHRDEHHKGGAKMIALQEKIMKKCMMRK